MFFVETEAALLRIHEISNKRWKNFKFPISFHLFSCRYPIKRHRLFIERLKNIIKQNNSSTKSVESVNSKFLTANAHSPLIFLLSQRLATSTREYLRLDRWLHLRRCTLGASYGSNNLAELVARGKKGTGWRKEEFNGASSDTGVVRRCGLNFNESPLPLYVKLLANPIPWGVGAWNFYENTDRSPPPSLLSSLFSSFLKKTLRLFVVAR